VARGLWRILEDVEVSRLIRGSRKEGGGAGGAAAALDDGGEAGRLRFGIGGGRRVENLRSPIRGV